MTAAITAGRSRGCPRTAGGSAVRGPGRSRRSAWPPRRGGPPGRGRPAPRSPGRGGACCGRWLVLRPGGAPPPAGSPVVAKATQSPCTASARPGCEVVPDQLRGALRSQVVEHERQLDGMRRPHAAARSGEVTVCQDIHTGTPRAASASAMRIAGIRNPRPPPGPCRSAPHRAPGRSPRRRPRPHRPLAHQGHQPGLVESAAAAVELADVVEPVAGLVQVGPMITGTAGPSARPGGASAGGQVAPVHQRMEGGVGELAVVDLPGGVEQFVR